MVDCTPAIGTVIPLGTINVTCTARDNTPNISTISFPLTVEDTTPPVIAAMGNITTEATGPAGATVSFTAPTATDLGVSIGVTCTPVPGGIFLLGTTFVICTATDASDNVSTAGFNVIMQDTTPPLMMAPADITTTATDANGAAVSYTVPMANDLVDGLTAVTCTPASQSTFLIGVTTVECISTDQSLNSMIVHFDITVEGITPRTIKADAVAALIVLRDAETDPRLLEDYNKAIDDVNNSLSPAYWDGIHPSTVEEFDATGILVGLMGENIFRFERHACRLIEKELKPNVTGPVSAELTEIQEKLYAADKELAQTGLDESTAVVSDPDHLAKSIASIADGTTAANAGDCGAIKFYQEGWTQAIGAR